MQFIVSECDPMKKDKYFHFLEGQVNVAEWTKARLSLIILQVDGDLLIRQGWKLYLEDLRDHLRLVLTGALNRVPLHQKQQVQQELNVAEIQQG